MAVLKYFVFDPKMLVRGRDFVCDWENNFVVSWPRNVSISLWLYNKICGWHEIFLVGLNCGKHWSRPRNVCGWLLGDTRCNCNQNVWDGESFCNWHRSVCVRVSIFVVDPEIFVVGQHFYIVGLTTMYVVGP